MHKRKHKEINNLDYSKLVSIPDAAAIAGCLVTSLYRKINNGTLPYYGLRGMYRVNLDDLLPKGKGPSEDISKIRRQAGAKGFWQNRIKTEQRTETSDSSLTGASSVTEQCSEAVIGPSEPDASA